MPDPSASDRDLALSVRRGNVEDYGELVRRYQTAVFNVCYRLLGERREAEDVAQEAFIRAYRRFDRYDAAQPFGPWIRRVAANLCLNQLGRHTLASVPLDEERGEREEPKAALGNPEAMQEQAERTAALRAALLALPPQYRAVVELRHFHELSYAEIADALDLPLSDVKSHLFRARKLLAAKLQEPAAGRRVPGAGQTGGNRES